jgi:tripeptide aminopeptidase
MSHTIPTPTYTVAERFMRYVQIDTQSDPQSSSVPSTEKQKNLAKLLSKELLEMGVLDVHMDDHGYVYAHLPSNVAHEVPPICFCAHMDTSPDSSGTGVKPLLHPNYQGQDIVLPDDPSVVIRLDAHKDLKQQIGNEIITASGTTLLGADDKAGVAEIMDAVHYWMHHPEVPHGPIKILFTVDEEIGRGVDHVDLERLGATCAYTLDGETAGSIEDETFSADGIEITIHGIGAHPGFAKGKMQNALKIGAAFIAGLPSKEWGPEHTDQREGFVHPLRFQGNAERCDIEFIVRDFEDDKLQAHGQKLYRLLEETVKEYPGCTFTFNQTSQYRNMKSILDQHPKIMEIGIEAIRRAGLTPIRRSIRGGTDGSRLTFMGLPCPNLFAGGHAFHSKQEWVSVQDMQAAVRTILHVAQLWVEQAPIKSI